MKVELYICEIFHLGDYTVWYYYNVRAVVTMTFFLLNQHDFWWKLSVPNKCK